MSELFGQALRKKRRAAGISQRELANRVDCDFSYISKMENNRVPPPAADTIVRICEALSIESEDLLALTGKLPSSVQETVSTSKAAQEFLRKAQQMNLRDEEWKAMTKSLHYLRNRNMRAA
jgi:transcriptional regulator with XRE-family HTH domain